MSLGQFKLSSGGDVSSSNASVATSAANPTAVATTTLLSSSPCGFDEDGSDHYLLLMPTASSVVATSSISPSSSSPSSSSSISGGASTSTTTQHELATIITSSADKSVLGQPTSNETKKVLVQFFAQHPMLKSFIAGSLSGTCSTLLFQPFDLVKTRIQNASFVLASPAGSSAAAAAAGSTAIATSGHQPNRFSSILVDVIKNEQLIGLWRGTVPSLMRCVPGVGLHFCCLDTLQSHFCSGRTPKAHEALIFGSVSRSLAGALLIPVTVVKTRYESGVYVYKSMTDAIRHTYRSEGARGLTSGLMPTLMRDVPFSGIYYMFFTQLKAFLFPIAFPHADGTTASTKPSLLSSSMVTFACGLNAGLLASLVTQPMDVVKTHMQLYPKRFPTSLSTVIFILQEKGSQGLFAGLVPRMMRRTLMASMAWTVYEQMMKNIGLK